VINSLAASFAPVVQLGLRISSQICEKFETALRELSWALGKMIHEKT
jgi:hypothetical protein